MKSTNGSFSISVTVRRKSRFRGAPRDDETLKLIRSVEQREQLTSELARQCRETIKEDLKERRAAAWAEAAEAWRSIHNTCPDSANRKTKMTALRRSDGSISPSRRVMEKVIYDFYSDLFDSHAHLPHIISGRMDMSSCRFCLPKSDMPSIR
ncbi:hypothetical protein ANCCEY_07259 [Ancylostoma ceylanicum]|uniref:Uncharacterized protein n=2 Tax=Ancylostoma ceylanicum TaxID=53326 RepID=A0A0D6LUA7_9BILA|nr:hypothetical protein ANCCEY_07259 [Ancylostoma ceylanicum]EYC38746.1 hypothetical protein Y032_0699g1634 [Ancylostoma ceylanicum]